MSKLSLVILLAEDDPRDVMLTRHALNCDEEIESELHVTRDGLETLDFLRKRGRFRNAPRPDLILLDLNMPIMDGHSVLAEVKADESLATIPVVILSGSDSSHDVIASYDLHANCYFTKPMDLNEYYELVQSVHKFWLSVVRIPQLDGQCRDLGEEAS